MKYVKSILFGLLGIFAFSNVNSAPISQIATVTQQLVAPPFLPEHSQIDNSSPKNIQVRMTIEDNLRSSRLFVLPLRRGFHQGSRASRISGVFGVENPYLHRATGTAK